MQNAINDARRKTVLAQLKTVAIDEFVNQSGYFPDSTTRDAEIVRTRAEIEETFETLTELTMQVWYYNLGYRADFADIDGAALCEKHIQLRFCAQETVVQTIHQVAAKKENEDIQAFFGVMLGIIHMSWLHWLEGYHRGEKAA